MIFYKNLLSLKSSMKDVLCIVNSTYQSILSLFIRIPYREINCTGTNAAYGEKEKRHVYEHRHGNLLPSVCLDPLTFVVVRGASFVAMSRV